MWTRHCGKCVAQEARDTGLCTRGSCRFWAFNSVVNICSKAFYFAQINSVIPSGLGPGWASKLYLLQAVFFFFLKYCGKQRRYLHLAGYVPFLPPSTYLKLELNFRREILCGKQNGPASPSPTLLWLTSVGKVASFWFLNCIFSIKASLSIQMETLVFRGQGRAEWLMPPTLCPFMLIRWAWIPWRNRVSHKFRGTRRLLGHSPGNLFPQGLRSDNTEALSQNSVLIKD